MGASPTPMFSADLSWTDQCAETVGQRRDRKLRGRDASSSTQSFNSDDSASKYSFWSLPARRKHSNTPKPPSNTSSTHAPSAKKRPSKLTLPESRSKPTTPTNTAASQPKDPIQDAGWSIPAELPPSTLPRVGRLPSIGALPPIGALPSIADSDSTVLESREPREPRSPRGSTTRSSVCTVQHVGADGQYREKRIIEEVEVHEVQQLSQDSYVSRTTTRSTEIRYAPFPGTITDEEQTSPSTRGRYVEQWLHFQQLITAFPPPPNQRVFPLNLTPPRSESSVSSTNQYVLDNDTASSAYHTPPDTDPKACNWEAPPDWDIASIRSYEVNRQSFENAFLCDPDAAELSQFQRFIRRMESAGPRVILDHLRNEPSPEELAADPHAEEELAVEKHLWVLTALQLQNMENSLVPNQGVGPLLGLPTMFRQPKRVLELYSNLAEVYQLSAIYPKSHISYLTVRPPLTSIPLPSNVHPLTVPHAGVVPLPYASDSFNHIRSASIPSHLPASKIIPLLRDLFRMLAPGGILELRLVDSTPIRATMGPRLRAWFEERVLLSVEKEFRCSRPLALVPSWVKECGFRVLEGGEHGKDLVVQRLRLPACAQPKDGANKHASLSSSHRGSVQTLRRKSRQENIKRSTLEYNQRNGIGGDTRCTDFAATLFEEPDAEESSKSNMQGELAALVARGLWKDTWGLLVDKPQAPGGRETIWWWDDPEIVRECWEYGTVFECGTIFAFKE